LLRRLGSSRPVGSVSEETEPSPVVRPAPESSPGGDATGAAGEGDRRLVASARSEGPAATAPMSSTRGGGTATDQRDGQPRWMSWRVLATSVGLVFVLALLAVTVVELAVGKPLASVVGSSQSGSGTTLSNLGSPPTTTTLPPATTVPTTTPTSGPGATTTSTTVPPASTTTTGVAAGSTTTTSSTTSTTTTTTTTTAPPTAGAGAGGG